MTEEEKIFARKIFDPRSQELRVMKHTAHLACQKYNTLDEFDPKRLSIIREFMGQIGKTYYFQGPIQFNYGCHTYIGENFFANFNLMVMDDARIYIGDNVCFGPCFFDGNNTPTDCTGTNGTGQGWTHNDGRVCR